MIKIKLREMMWDRKVSAVDIQKATGIHVTTISNIIHEKHHNIGLDLIDKLCNFFDCKIEDIVEYKK